MLKCLISGKFLFLNSNHRWIKCFTNSYLGQLWQRRPEDTCESWKRYLITEISTLWPKRKTCSHSIWQNLRIFSDPMNIFEKNVITRAVLKNRIYELALSWIQMRLDAFTPFSASPFIIILFRINNVHGTLLISTKKDHEWSENLNKYEKQ